MAMQWPSFQILFIPDPFDQDVPRIPHITRSIFSRSYALLQITLSQIYWLNKTAFQSRLYNRDPLAYPPTDDLDMSVLLETSLGEIVIDLLVDSAPKCCEK